MAQYTATMAANLLRAPDNLPERVTATLIQYAASRYAADAAEGGVSLAFTRRLTANPYGVANTVVPILVSTINVAARGSDEAPEAPTDAELLTSITALWPFLVGS